MDDFPPQPRRGKGTPVPLSRASAAISRRGAHVAHADCTRSPRRA